MVPFNDIAHNSHKIDTKAAEFGFGKKYYSPLLEIKPKAFMMTHWMIH